jgi:hypothetical protein
VSDEKPSEYMRLADVKRLGLTRTDAERVFRRCALFRMPDARYYYARRVDVERVLREAQVKS